MLLTNFRFWHRAALYSKVWWQKLLISSSATSDEKRFQFGRKLKAVDQITAYLNSKVDRFGSVLRDLLKNIVPELTNKMEHLVIKRLNYRERYLIRLERHSYMVSC